MYHLDERAAAAGNRIANIDQLSEAASLRLLSAVDNTVDTLAGVSKVTSGLSVMLAKTASEIDARTVVEGEYIDENDEAIDVLASAAARMKTLLTQIVRRRAAIDRDNRLKGHHCESLHESYEQATAEIADLIEVLENTRAAIITHDLKAEPRSNLQTFETVEDLIDSLHGA